MMSSRDESESARRAIIASLVPPDRARSTSRLFAERMSAGCV